MRVVKIELKAFVPARDLDRSIAFYNAIGFSTIWNDGQLALLGIEGFKFLLQRFYTKNLAENFVMHLLVNHADDWWRNVSEASASKPYDIRLTKPEDRDWGIRDFTFLDPSGVLWRVGNPIS